jgi:hypothetical protein
VSSERSYQDDLNTAALSELLGMPPFVVEETEPDDDPDNQTN